MAYKLNIHPEAEEDVDRIYDYIDLHHGQGAADAWVAGIDHHYARLELFPSGYAVVAPAPPRPVHRVPVKNHLVYHEVFEVEQVVRVLYVWSGRRGTRPDLQRRYDKLV